MRQGVGPSQSRLSGFLIQRRLELVNCLFKAPAIAERFKQFHDSAHPVKGRDLEYPHVIEVDHALILILVQQRLQNGADSRSREHAETLQRRDFMGIIRAAGAAQSVFPRSSVGTRTDQNFCGRPTRSGFRCPGLLAASACLRHAAPGTPRRPATPPE